MITINGREREWREGLTVMSLLQELQVNPRTVVVEINRKQTVLYSEYERFKVQDGDRVEIIVFAGGGVRKGSNYKQFIID